MSDAARVAPSDESTALCVVTPSCIRNSARLDYATRALASLDAALGSRYPHIVVDDPPIIGSAWFRRGHVDPTHADAACRVYGNRANTTLIRRRTGGGSASAVLQALRIARSRGGRYVFIHLDDNVYVPILATLLRHAHQAMEQDGMLRIVRLAGYPVLWEGCTPEQGNRSSLTITKDRVLFDRIELRPHRYDDCTVWWTAFDENMRGEKSYPIALWSGLFQIDFLEALLTFCRCFRSASLAEVELFYCRKRGWRRALRRFAGKLAYINMQFGGIEMERSGNWQALLSLPNEPVR